MATLSLSTLNTLKVAAFCVLVFFINGCGEKSQNTNVNNNAPPPLPLTELANLKYMVKEKMKYEKFDEKNACHIRTVDGKPYCANIKSIILSVEHGTNFIYAFESGVELDESGLKLLCRVCYGGVAFFKFSLQEDNKIKLINESEDVCGPYGSDECEGIAFRYGSGPEKGWIVQNAYGKFTSAGNDTTIGVAVSNTRIYLPLGDKVIEVLNLNEASESQVGDSSSDKGDSKGVGEYTKIKLLTIPDPSRKVYDLKGIFERVQIVNGKSVKTTKEETIKFDEKKLKYDTEQFKKL